ncbi:hypothetical protein BJX64DRAFT_295115 [Aspergillus heterothallicus]
MASLMREVRMIILSDSCCARGSFIYQYSNGCWHDLRHYGSCCWDGFRKQAVIDEKMYLIAFEDESPYFITDSAYFNARNLSPPHGYVVLYDVTSRESFESAERSLKVIVIGLRERSLGRSHMYKGKVTADARSGSAPSKNELQRGNRLSRALPWTRHNHTNQHKPQEPSTSFTLFPHLPGELQLAILRACLTSPTPVIDQSPHLAGININILLVNRFFHAEGTKIYQNENDFLPRRPIHLVADTSWAGWEGKSAVIFEGEGRALADRYGCVFCESSSRSTEDVKNVVDGFVRDVVARGRDLGGFEGGSGVRKESHVRSIRRSLTQRVSKIFH